MEIKAMSQKQATRALKQQNTQTYIVRKNTSGEIIVSTKDFKGRIAHTLFKKQQGSDVFVATPRFMNSVPDMLKRVAVQADSLDKLVDQLSERLGDSLYAPRGRTFEFNVVAAETSPSPPPPNPAHAGHVDGMQALDVMRRRAANRSRPPAPLRGAAASRPPSSGVRPGDGRAPRARAGYLPPIAADALPSTDFSNMYGNALRVPDYRAALHDVELASGSMMINLMNMARLQPSQIKDRLVENRDGTITVKGLYHPFTGEPLPDQRVDLKDQASKSILRYHHLALQNAKNMGNQTWAVALYIAAAKNFTAAVDEYGTSEEKSNQKISLANVTNQKVIDLMLHGRTAVDVPLATQTDRAAAEHQIQRLLDAKSPMSVSLRAHDDYKSIRNLAVIGMYKNIPGRVFLDLSGPYDCGKITFRMPLDEFSKYDAALSYLPID
jgi:hypothetical protein